ncbi:MAG: hypothetical protein LBR79_04550 [Oscillospiraceae bacterium]|nr:hypothetical protein [Oscillospiraceae bacterium]
MTFCFPPRLLRGEKEEVSTILKHDSLQTMTFLFSPPPSAGGRSFNCFET